MDLFRCNSLSGWDPRSIQSILCRVSLQRVKALLFEISSGELSGNQKWLSPSEAPNVSPPWFSPRHRTAWLHLPSPREQAAAADNRDGSGCWRWAEQLTMPQLSQPLAARRLVAAGTKSPGCLHLLAPMEHSGADRAEAMPSAAGSASLPSSASPALRLQAEPWRSSAPSPQALAVQKANKGVLQVKCSVQESAAWVCRLSARG